jgi:hypothetical protein
MTPHACPPPQLGLLAAELEAAVQRATATAPRFLEGASWELERDGPDWVLRPLQDKARPNEAQPRMLACGAAVEHLVAVLHGWGLRAAVHPIDGDGRVRVEVIGSAAPTVVDLELLGALGQPVPPDTNGRDPEAGLTPDAERLLTLAAEGVGADVLWSTRDRPDLHGLSTAAEGTGPRPMASVVTRGDEAADWLAAGRAFAKILLRARSLDLFVQPLVHALSRAETRRAVRETWHLPAYPQVQLIVGRTAASSQPARA